MKRFFKALGILCLILSIIGFIVLSQIIWPKVDGDMNPVTAHSPYPVSKNAKALHDELWIADLHADNLLCDITRLAKAQLWPPRTWGSIYERAAYQAQRLQKLEKKGEVHIIRTRADIAKTDRLLGLLLIEGAHPLEGDIKNIKRLYDEGFRAMGLQHFFDNELGGSMHGRSKAGLSEFGREAVLEMARQDIMIDVAHSSVQTVPA